MSARTGGATLDQLADTHQVRTRYRHVGARSRLARAGAFLLHLLAMILAMGVGMAVLDPVYRLAVGQLGYTSPYLQLPELTLLVSAFDMAAPMAAWMRFRGMDWQSTAEMSAAMVGEAALIIGGYWLGILPNVSAGSMSTLGHLEHGLMLPAMLVPMLLRLDRYTGHKRHTA